MEHFPGPMTREESDAFVQRMEGQWREHEYGRYCVEVPGEADCIGFVGISPLPFMPESDEIGWRLARPFWSRGFASEGARAVLAEAFERMGRAEIISVTVPANTRSIAVMTRIGMSHDRARDFEHPTFPRGDRLSRHVLYRVTRSEWEHRVPK